MAQRVARTTLTVADRVDMIRCLENNESQVSVALKFGVHQSQVSRIRKNKDRILKEWLNNSNPLRKRIRAGKSEDIEDALRHWFYQARNRQIPVNGSLLKRKASKLARDLGLTDFKVTTGWLERWKARNAIKLGRHKGTPTEGEDFATDHWVTQVLPDVLENEEHESNQEHETVVSLDTIKNESDQSSSSDEVLSETSINSVIDTQRPILKENGDAGVSIDGDVTDSSSVSLVTVVHCLHIIRRFMEQKGCESYEQLYNLQDLLYRLNRQPDNPDSASNFSLSS